MNFRFLLALLFLWVGHSMSNAQTRFVRTVNTIADLVSAMNNPNQIHTNIFVAQYATDRPSGGGNFQWFPGDTSPTNSGLCFASKYFGASGRFKRIDPGALNVKAFGAYGDNNPAHDDTDAIQETIYVAPERGEVTFPPGTYSYRNLTVKNNLRLTANHSVLTLIGGNPIGLSVSNVSNVVIEGLEFRGEGTNQVYVDMKSDAHDIAFRDCVWLGNGINATPSTIGIRIARSYINNFEACSLSYLDYGVLLNDPNANRNSFTDCSIRGNGWGLRQVGGFQNTFTGGDIEGGNGHVYVSDGSLSLANSYFEVHLGAYGIIVTNTGNLAISSCLEMADTYVAMAGTGRLSISDSFWRCISCGSAPGPSSTNAPFVRYTDNNTGRLFLHSDIVADPGVLYRHAQYWNGSAWLNKTYLNEDIDANNSVFFPLPNELGSIDYKISSKRELDGMTGLGRYPRTNAIVSLSSNVIPTNQFPILTMENAFQTGTYWAMGIDENTKLAWRDSGNLTVNTLELDMSGNLAARGSISGGTNRFFVDNTGVIRMLNGESIGIWGATSGPENVIIANPGSLTLRNDGRLWVKQSGTNNVGWAIIPTMSGVPAASVLRSTATNSIGVVAIGAGLTWDGVTLNVATNSSGSSSNAYSRAFQDSVALTARTNINFIGPFLSASDNAPSNRTDVAFLLTTAAGITNNGNVLSGNYTAGSNIALVTNANGAVAISSSGSGITINPTDGFIPYRLNGTNFADSSFKRENADQTSLSYRAANNFGPTLLLLKQGRVGSATNTPVTGAQLGTFSFGAWRGDTDLNMQSIQGIATENWGPSANGYKIQFSTSANGSGTSPIVFTLDQDGKVNVPGLAINSYLGVDGSHNLVPTNAPAAAGITATTGDVIATGPGSVPATISNDAVTYAKMQNVSAASKLLGRGDSGAGDPQEITLGANLSMTGTTLSAASTGIVGYQKIGTGGDFGYTLGQNVYEKVAFGTSGPSFTLTNAASYQIMLSVAAKSNNSFNQRFWVTNVTDHVGIAGTYKTAVVSSDEVSVPIIFQVTTAGANKSFELWGTNEDSAYTVGQVTATNTVLNVIRF